MGMIGNTLAQGLVSGANLVDGTVDTVDIKDAAVTPAKLSAGAPSWDSSGNVTASGNMILSGTGKRITGDFSNATIANRVLFQTSTTNGGTLIRAVPNGTSQIAGFQASNSADPTNSSGISVQIDSAGVASVQSISNGTGTYLPLTLNTGGSERMRVDTSGNVGVGTSSPTSKLDVLGTASVSEASSAANAGGQLNFNARNDSASIQPVGYIKGALSNGVSASYSGGIVFGTALNNTYGERMRIDSSGNLQVGGTGQSGRVVSYADSVFLYRGYSTGGSWKFGVDQNGQIYSPFSSIASTSDRSLKENIRELETGLSEVMSLQPRRFDWIDGDKDVAGFIAREVEQVLPELVISFELSEGVHKKALRMGDIVPSLVKAIQEQQAIIEQLKSRIEILEAN